MEDARAVAQANEYMYYKLREQGLSKQIDVSIGIEFINLDKLIEHSDSSPFVSGVMFPKSDTMLRSSQSGTNSGLQ